MGGACGDASVGLERRRQRVDRLEEIKKKDMLIPLLANQVAPSDIYWLIAEVERLREINKVLLGSVIELAGEKMSKQLAAVLILKGKEENDGQDTRVETAPAT